ncbi:MAG: hypothetical protein ACP5H2_09475 [Solirubrobacteraceae bacterium]
MHVLDAPEHPPPDQPANTDPEADVSVNVTVESWSNHPEHSSLPPPLLQLIPAGLLDTDPDPEPASETVNLYNPGSVRDPAADALAGSKSATTAAQMATTIRQARIAISPFKKPQSPDGARFTTFSIQAPERTSQLQSPPPG